MPPDAYQWMMAINAGAPGAADSHTGRRLERIAGAVERVTFHSAETGFCVLRVKVRGQRDLVTVTGHAAAIGAGEYAEATGVWLNDRNHGLQFKAEWIEATVPTTLEGLEKYLGSGMIKGIGPVYAKKLVGTFGHDVFEVIEREPTRLREVTGIGPVREAKIIRGWTDQRAIREIIVWLYSHRVSSARAVRIFKTYGEDAISVISADPYQLARDIAGIGFKTADAIASSIGYAKDDPRRVRAGVAHALTTAMNDGHCGLPRADLVRSGAELLEVSAPLVEAALAGELAAGEVIAGSTDGQEVIFLAGLYRAEQAIADALLRLRVGILPWPAIAVAQAIPWVERRTGIALSESQQDALGLALVSKVCVITGGPGVGKTTLVRSILQVLAAKRVRIALAAPTGRAAKRLAEASGMEAMTLHRLLESDPGEGGFKRNADNPLECDLLVVDEASMVDVMLMHATMRALPRDAALLLVGDVDQLPSVGPGQVLKDVIASGAVPVVRLTEVFRQAAESRIITNAHRINAGEMPDLSARDRGDFFFVEADEPGDVAEKVVELVARHIPRRFGLDPARDIQVLGPMQRGGAGARALNLLLQQRINPPSDQAIERFGQRYGPGDKVMHIVNDRERDIYNGDLGVVTGVDHVEGELHASFGETAATFDFGELDALQLAYATTIHKTQGSDTRWSWSRSPCRPTPCSAASSSTPPSPAPSGWSCWSDRARRSPLRSSAGSRGAGRGYASGCPAADCGERTQGPRTSRPATPTSNQKRTLVHRVSAAKDHLHLRSKVGRRFGGAEALPRRQTRAPGSIRDVRKHASDARRMSTRRRTPELRTAAPPPLLGGPADRASGR